MPLRLAPSVFTVLALAFPDLALAQQVPSAKPPIQLTPQPNPQTQVAPDATPAPAIGLPRGKPRQDTGFFKEPPRLTGPQVATLNRISQIYNGIQEMSGTFTQVEQKGVKTTGRFYMTKPGRVRFQYDKPAQLEIIGDGEQILVRDKRLRTQDVYPLWQTPLRYLLKQKIDLLQDARVVSVLQDQDMITVTIEEEGALTQGQLTLYFSSSDYSLKQWTTVDGPGSEIDVAVANVVTNKPNDKRLFSFDYVPPNQ